MSIGAPNPGDFKAVVRDRAIRVFKFLRELAGLRSKTARDTSDYDVWWLSDLPREHGCHFIGWDSVAEVDAATPWVEIKKPSIKPPPTPPAVLKPWITIEQISDSSLEQPEIQQIIEVPGPNLGDPSQVKVLEEYPEIVSEWEQFLDKQWRPWASRDRIQRQIQLEYSKLFSMYQRQKALGENYEVLFCFGYLTWRSKQGYSVARHLVTAQASIAFDDVRGIITVGPGSDGARLTLEQDMLDVEDRPVIDDLENQLRDCEFIMWDGHAVPDILKGWINRLSADGEFDSSLTNQVERTNDPHVNLAPAIVMRRRGERTIVRLFKDLIEKFESGRDPSDGIVHLVAIVDDRRDGELMGEDAKLRDGRPLADDMYLPLPANDEQRLIVDRLQHNQGVLVQGPPGTGKSHTIANLLCHLLASGKRVLVTSHTARALAVLQRKLPPEISDLCVLLLGNDLTALEGLENSVRVITDRYNNRNDEQSVKQIAELEQLLDTSRKLEASLQHDLRVIREADIFEHTNIFGEYSGTTQAIANLVREGEPQYGWIRSLIDPTSPPPLTDAEALELLDLQQKVDYSIIAALEAPRPSSKDFPSPAEFSESVRLAHQLMTRRDSLVARADSALNSRLSTLSHNDLVYLRSTVSSLVAALRAFEKSDPWVQVCSHDIIRQSPQVWDERLETTKRHLTKIGDRGRWATERKISGLDGADLTRVSADTSELITHFNNGGGLGFGPFKPAPVKRGRYIIEGVRVDGKVCNTAPTLDNLRVWLAINLELQNLDRVWSQYASTPTGSISIQQAHFAGLRDKLTEVMKLESLVAQANSKWQELGHVEPLWSSADDLQRLSDTLEYCSASQDYETSIRPQLAIEQKVRSSMTSPQAHEVASAMLRATETRDSTAYAVEHNRLIELENHAAKVKRWRELIQRLSTAAPKLVDYIRTRTDHAPLHDKVADLSHAWHWAQADDWLVKITDPQRRLKLESDVEYYRTKTRKYLTDLASEKAWSWCLRSMTKEQRRNLDAWQQEIKKLGKGTGKHAAKHRQNAREYLEGARGAVPAWVMPMYRLADTISADSERFDVVIVDEASQSGPDAMFLLEFAKQVIIVGDDKQIKPEIILDREPVDKLRKQYIPDIPSSTLIGSIDTSLFEVGELLYGGRVRLREHFRCMPEIIQFSNNLCYSSEPLIPLKQFGASRLKPVVSTVHVKGGYQKGPTGRIVNPPEAEAVVDFISEAVRNPLYAKKTFGVISLLGEDQARLIEQLLLESIGPEEMQRRDLVCGDAYAFQGDERHVMVLSMVSAPTAGAHIGVLAKQTDERRFNVAASRAQDQMILFHSATLNDISPKCLRHRLLEYCLHPQIDPLEVAGIKLDDLRALAFSVSRDKRRPPEPFDSWFEVDVCIQVMERGYRVVPQYEIAGYFVDLMVEGMNGRIAVECDGDKWHGPEQFDRDAFRQRELERAGLHFFRPRGSDFYRSPTDCMFPLWQMLGSNRSAYTEETSSQPSADQAEPNPTVVDSIIETSTQEYVTPESVETTAESAQNELEERLEQEIAEAAEVSSLPPYREWELEPMPDPRTCRQDDIINGLIKIVQIEGPIVFSRAYHLYARAAGIQRVGHQLHSTFNRAAAKAVRQTLLKQSEEPISFGQSGRTAWIPDTPNVISRQRGARTANEIPRTEIAEIARRINSSTQLRGYSLVEPVARAFGIGRLTTSTRLLILQALKVIGLA